MASAVGQDSSVIPDLSWDLKEAPALAGMKPQAMPDVCGLLTPFFGTRPRSASASGCALGSVGFGQSDQGKDLAGERRLSFRGWPRSLFVTCVGLLLCSPFGWVLNLRADEFYFDGIGVACFRQIAGVDVEDGRLHMAQPFSFGRHGGFTYFPRATMLA
jgi:hypothetical protein